MDQPPSNFQPPHPPAGPRVTSLPARLLNIFAVPGDVFDEVKSAPFRVGNWLVPVLLASTIGVISALIVFSQPAVFQKLRERQVQKLDAGVKAGTITREQADKTLAFSDKYFGPQTMKIAGGLGAAAGGFIRVFWWAFVLWLLALFFLKVKLPYVKLMEMVGLASMISILGMIVTLLLTVNFGKLMSAPGLASAFGDFDVQKQNPLLLGVLVLFTFWFLGVLSSGLSRLSGAPFARAMLLVGFYWLISELFLLSTGFGQMVL
jgi:hypothetical protein